MDNYPDWMNTYWWLKMQGEDGNDDDVEEEKLDRREQSCDNCLYNIKNICKIDGDELTDIEWCKHWENIENWVTNEQNQKNTFHSFVA